MRSYLITVMCICIISADVSPDDFQLEGYYWRDYIGKIPKDALPGGLNSEGNTTYIGQVLHAHLLIPAEISPQQSEVTYEWGYIAFVTNKNIKILCTPYPERFEWITTGNGLLQNVANKTIMSGGYEPGAKIYIGRKQLKKELSVGKIVSTEIQTTLNTIKGDKVTQHIEFDILSYNPNIEINHSKNNNSCDPPGDHIDVRYGS